MSLLLYEKAAENGQKGHDQRKEKDQSVASCFIKDQASQISPEATRKVVNRNDKTCKKTNMRHTIQPSHKSGGKGTRYEGSEAEGKSKNIERKGALVSQNQKKQDESYDKS